MLVNDVLGCSRSCGTSTPGNSIAAKELISILIATILWGPKWEGQRVDAYCDNSRHAPPSHAYTWFKQAYRGPYSQQTPAPTRARLPITPAELHAMRAVWDLKSGKPDIVMLWAASVLCFIGFFRVGEITVPSSKAVDPSCYLSWDDVTVDDHQDPKMLKIYLKRSKTDQLGKGSEIFIGRASCPLCPVIPYIG